jgi:hypothetical protein
MADTFSPTIIQQPVPVADMTPLKILALSLIFDAEPDGEALYFHASLGPKDTIELSIDKLRAAFDGSAGIENTVAPYIAERGAVVAPTTPRSISAAGPGSSSFRTSRGAHPRSATSRQSPLSIRSKMRPDGFGGTAVLMTADAILGKSTNDILEDFLAEREGDAADDGEHVLLRVREDAVRVQIGQAIEADPTPTSLTADAVNGADIRAARLAVVACSDLTEEQDAAEFRAALTAIHEAEQRRAPAFDREAPPSPP